MREAVRAYRRAVWSQAREHETETVRRLDIIDAACDLFPTVGRRPGAQKKG